MKLTKKHARARRLTFAQIDRIARGFNLEGQLAEYLGCDVADLDVAAGFAVETSLGALKICIGRLWADNPLRSCPGGDTIFCRFAEPRRAAGLGANPHSGKWNHHAFIAPCHGLTDPAEVTARLRGALSDFMVAYERIRA